MFDSKMPKSRTSKRKRKWTKKRKLDDEDEDELRWLQIYSQWQHREADRAAKKKKQIRQMTGQKKWQETLAFIGGRTGQEKEEKKKVRGERDKLEECVEEGEKKI